MLIEIVIENEFCPFSSTANLHYEKFSDGTIKCLKKEIPFKIPSTWTWVRLGFIGNWGAGATPNRAHSEYYGGDIPWLKTVDLNDDYITEIPETITELALKETSVKLNPVGSILIAMYGATIGKLGILTKQATTNQACCACCPVEGVYNKYLFYFLMSHKTKFINRGIGGAQPNISKEKIVATLMPLPPIDEQLRIVSSIESLFFNIERIVNEQLNISELVVKTKSKILDLAIRGKLVPQNPDDEPATMLLARIRREKEELIKAGKLKRDKRESVIFRGEDNSYYEKLMGSSIEKQIKIPFDLPNGWVWVRGRDCFSGMTNTIPTGIDFDYIDIDSIDNREHKITKPKHLNVSDAPSRAKRAVYTGSVLFSLVRPYLQNIARVSEKHKDCIASTGFYVCNSNGVLSSEYLFYLMISPYVVNGLNQFMKGDNSPSINKDDIENWLYPIPPLKEQKRITYQIEKLLTQITKIASALK